MVSPHFEFPFEIRRFRGQGYQFELRHALEPGMSWAKGSPGGTVRYVDSSVERVQVKVTGMAPDRYILTCNGRPVPLTNTGKNGEFVAGVATVRLAAGVLSASDHWCACAAGLRHRRYLDAAFSGRMPVPRLSPGRAEF